MWSSSTFIKDLLALPFWSETSVQVWAHECMSLDLHIYRTTESHFTYSRDCFFVFRFNTVLSFTCLVNMNRGAKLSLSKCQCRYSCNPYMELDCVFLKAIGAQNSLKEKEFTVQCLCSCAQKRTSPPKKFKIKAALWLAQVNNRINS